MLMPNAKLAFRLYNGAKTKEAWNPASPHFIDDWKPEMLEMPCDYVQFTYGHHISVECDDERVEFFVDNDGYIEHEGVFYGDFVVVPAPRKQPRRRKADNSKPLYEFKPVAELTLDTCKPEIS
jgi:hypothetical protein